MQPHRQEDVTALAHDVQALVHRLKPADLRRRPNSYEPTVAELLARALLELDRLTSEEGNQSQKAPPSFADGFLTRRLSRRLLDRYPGAQLPAEFERRLNGAIDHSEAKTATLERIRRLLADLETALPR